MEMTKAGLPQKLLCKQQPAAGRPPKEGTFYHLELL